MQELRSVNYQSQISENSHCTMVKATHPYQKMANVLYRNKLRSFNSARKAENKHIIFVFRYFQRLPVVKVTLPFLPNVTIQTQDGGFLTILTSGSVIQVIPELMYS